MRWRRSFIFIALLAALSFFYFHEIYQVDQFPPFLGDAAQTYILKVQNQKSVKKMSIEDRSKGTKILFEKDSQNNWQIVSPIHFPAEAAIVDGFVTLLKLMPRLRPLTAKQIDLKEFGFDHPRLRICIGISSKAPRCLLIGNDSAIGEGAYAKWDDESSYFLVEPVFLKSFDRTLYSVQKNQIFNLFDEEIASIQFESEKKEIKIIHEGKNWMLKKPVEAAIGLQTMDALLRELHGLFVKEFLDSDDSAERIPQIVKPVRTIRIFFRHGKQQVLMQGEAAVGRDAFYARLSEPDTVFLVSQGKLNQLEDLFSKLGA